MEKGFHLQGVLQEIGNALKRCESETSNLEDALSTWALTQQDKLDFPSMQLQRLDYLKQIQADLSVTVHNISSYLVHASTNSLVISSTDLLVKIKLNEVRQHLLNASVSESLSDGGVGASIDDHSDVHFFLDD